MAQFSPQSLEPVAALIGITGSASEKLADMKITGVAYDSRQVESGDAFICIPGQHVDGNRYIQEALDRGAACIISEKPNGKINRPYLEVPDVRLAMALIADHCYGYPSRKLRPLGITGTNGKTTVTHLVEHIFRSAGYRIGLIGTLGSRWEDTSGYLEIKHTTPQSSDLHRLLHSMVEAGCSHVAMEVSSHALEQKRVAGCNFAIACLTNVSQDHLDYHQTMLNYWQSKRKLFEEINESMQTNRSVIVNLDDALAQEFLKVASAELSKWTYGYSEDATIHVKSVDFGFKGTDLTLNTHLGPVSLRLKYTGSFNVYNTMAALMICLAEGLDLKQCKDGLESFSGVAGRFEVVSTDLGAEPLCIVDYAHTPDGLDNVLQSARKIVPEDGRLIVVFGCGGDRDSSKRPQMGEIAESIGDRIIVTSDNPRTEDPQQIIANILAGIKQTRSVSVEPDRASAIRLAIADATERDVIVVAGKGHENYQILAHKTIPFDDRTEVRIALEEKYKTTSSR